MVSFVTIDRDPSLRADEKHRPSAQDDRLYG